jgi:hypothetical protein
MDHRGPCPGPYARKWWEYVIGGSKYVIGALGKEVWGEFSTNCTIDRRGHAPACDRQLHGAL